MRARLAVAIAAAAVLSLTSAGHAAPAPQVKDPTGDALAAQAASDIVSVTYSTTGKKVGRKYVADTLVIAMKLAAAPHTSGGTYLYYTRAEVSDCGSFETRYSPGASSGSGSFFLACGSQNNAATGTSTLIQTNPKVTGSVITWSMKLRALPREIKVGSQWSALSAYTDVVEPFTGILGPGAFGLPLDSASSTKTWKLG